MTMSGNIRKLLFGVAVGVLLAGCVSPEYRIRKNPEVFARFPPDVQETVRKGSIKLGYTRDMAFIALGEPSRIFQRETEHGRVEIWSYTDIGYRYDHQPVPQAYGLWDRGGHLHVVHGLEWVDVQQAYEFEIGRVEFTEGKVTAIERLQP